MPIETLNHYVALGTLLAQILGAAFVALYFLRKKFPDLEDVAVICDADGDDLASSRHFWLPEDDDPIPLTLTAMRLMAAAPLMLAALLLAQRALNTAPRFRVGDTDS